MADSRDLAYRLGLQLTSHTALYASSAGIVFAVGLANVAVLTRFLSIDEFGQLAVLLVFAALLTIVYNLVSLQGTFGLVYRGGGEDEGIVDPAEEDPADLRGLDKRRTLTTGLAATAVVAAFGTGLVCLFASSLSHVLGDVPASWVRLAAFSGAAGSIWRFVVNVLRFERRPTTFLALNAMRPIAVLGISIPLVVNGHGVGGVLFATTVGTLAAVLVAAAASAASFGRKVQASALEPIARRGVYLVPVIVAFWIVNNVDLYLVSVFAGEADAARYRVASRIAAGMAYFVSAFLMAWMPLSRTVVHEAIARRHGADVTGGTMLLYYWAAAAWVVLGLYLVSDLLVAIAPATYGAAAPLIPLIAAGFAAYGVFIVIHRSASIAGKNRLYGVLALLAAAVFTGTALLLVPAYGSYGAAVAPLVGFGLVAAVELALSQRGPKPLDIPFARLAIVTMVAASIGAVGAAAASITVGAHLLAAGILTAAFPLLLSRTGLVPLPALGDLHRASRRSREAAIRERLPSRGSEDWRVAEALLGANGSPASAADRLGVSEDDLLFRFSRLLERLAATAVPDTARVQTARYLLMAEPAAIRDDVGARVLAAGVEPEALVDLETAHEVLRKATRQRQDHRDRETGNG